MAVLSKGRWDIDYIDAGTGPPVVLIHSSVSGNKQWRSLIEDLKGHYHVLAVNLFGYGDTTPRMRCKPSLTMSTWFWRFAVMQWLSCIMFVYKYRRKIR